ncbi:MAG: NAD(P)/FAD-dependent oxidoreductase [Arthrobacter sp.]|uniref:NAD(P)/FAD-dependent oxidoreductase n=1 Tax=unclassified Arthrobacter TaxID=235627 RepID=UPI002650F2CB|nr:FAD-binding oxidoreductase [Micrococcaceae bacterium]MDN5822706.1 FAD-binding oxidoreductase [Micrococcaceae bacterium]MDN5878170.1 FAD-binding oxidoreductase [Micrococcaceae bacterium]MDN5886550.1 FAD-binding oxidoreductase [Micrococcaceae bacterium]
MGMQHPEHVVVVGAGIVGLSTAWHLQERGVRVTIVDRTGVSAGSSWGNAGWLTPALTLPLSEPSVFATGAKAMLDPASPLYIPLTTDPSLIRFLAGFARHCTPGKWREAMKVFSEIGSTGLDAFAELAEGSNAVTEPTKPAEPFLAAFATEKDREGLVHEFEGIREAGGSVDFDLMTGAEIRALEPTLGSGVTAGVKIHDQRFLNPPNFMESLAESVRQRGGEIIDGFAVSDVRDSGNSVTVIGSSGRSMTADSVVLATGAWLNSLTRKFGVRQIVQAGRGYSFTVKPESMPTHPIYFPAQRVACTPLGDRFRVAGMMEFRDADAPLDERRIQAIIKAASPMYTGIDWEDRQEEWVGARPCTADGLPLIGATKSPRVHVAGGHGMWGVALGPLTGKMLAAEMTGQGTAPLMRHFSPLR